MFTSYVRNSVVIVKVSTHTAYELPMFEGVARAMVNAIARNLHLEDSSVWTTYTHGREMTIDGNYRETITLKRFGDIDDERNLQLEVAIPRDDTLLHALDKAHQAARRSLSNRLCAPVVFPESTKQYPDFTYTLEVTREQFK